MPKSIRTECISAFRGSGFGVPWVFGCLGIWVFLTAPALARQPTQKPLPSLVRKTDALIEDHFGGGLTSDWGWAIQYDKHRRGEIAGGIRSGRFGVLSGGRLYTTWRAISPLTDVAYSECTATVYDHHVSNVHFKFKISKPYVTFLLSGGNAPGVACVNLLVDDKVVRTATGRNDDILEWVAFDVTNYVGRTARLQVLDTSTAAFDYITIDCVCQSPDTKGAVRVIAEPPAAVKTVSHVETVAGKRTGPAAIKDGRLMINGQPVDLKELLSWNTGATSADATGRRVELVNGDAIAGNVSGLQDGKLILDSATLGETNLPLSAVAQVLFTSGPSIDAEPGVLIHSNGNKIPGELTWIRDDNISIKCALGQLPLPRGRVRAFVFGEKKPVAAEATVVFADGSSLSGTLTLVGDGLVLTHAALGAVEVAMADVVRVTRRVAGVTPLASLRADVRERVGPVPPPLPLRADDERGAILRMFPRTVVRYALPKAAAPRRLRGVLAPVPNARPPVKAHVRVGNAVKTYTVKPDSDGVPFEVDLGSATSFELVADATSTVSYPCGVEWRNAIIVGAAK